MPVIMIFYYIISIFLAGLIVWNFIREKKDMESAVKLKAPIVADIGCGDNWLDAK